MEKYMNILFSKPRIHAENADHFQICVHLRESAAYNGLVC